LTTEVDDPTAASAVAGTFVGTGGTVCK
jgi:hypothetical protein